VFVHTSIQRSVHYLFANCCIFDSRYVFGSSYSYTANSNIRNGLDLCKFNSHINCTIQRQVCREKEWYLCIIHHPAESPAASRTLPYHTFKQTGIWFQYLLRSITGLGNSCSKAKSMPRGTISVNTIDDVQL